MRYLKIKSIIFEIDLCEDSENFESDDKIVDPQYATYQTNKFKILNYTHIADNQITEDEFNMCLIYLYINSLNHKLDDNLINDNLINIIKKEYNVNKMDDFINKEINRHIYYFKSYERAFNYRFIYDKQYELFKNGYSGTYRNYTRNGEIILEFYHINGVIEGPCKRGYDIYNYVNGKPIDGGSTMRDIINLDHHFFDHE